MLYNDKLLDAAIKCNQIKEARFGAIITFISAFPGNPGQWLQHAKQKSEAAFGENFYDEYDEKDGWLPPPDPDRAAWNRSNWVLAQEQLAQNFSKKRFEHLIAISDYLRMKQEHADFMRVPDHQREQNAIESDARTATPSEEKKSNSLSKEQLIGAAIGVVVGSFVGIPGMVVGAGVGFVVGTALSKGAK